MTHAVMAVLRIVEDPFVSRENLGAWTVATIGALIGLAAVVLVLANPEPPMVRAFELGLGIGVPAFIVYGGYRLVASDHQPSDQRRIAVWTVVGTYFAGLFGLLLVLHQRLEGGAIVEPGYFLLVLMASGALVGFLSSAGTSATRISNSSLPKEASSPPTEDVD
jgi:hypothetical protein